jgi:GT2 family glycosyltransferase/2-polyprenyl-3-methyl-5-hydroxy-6-metoxy-1,4-benzoquinol methylase
MPTASDAHLYDQYYYEHGCGSPYKRTPEWLQFYAKIADAIVRQIGPRTVLDAGCALGFIVEALRDRGVEAFGIDISEYAIQNVREDIQPYVRVASLLDPLSEPYDLIVCSEVLEHLTAAEGEQAIENLCKASDDILFSSTPEDYREATHFNVRPPDYWSTLFALYGFVRDVDFDSSFLTPWAVRFRRNHEPMHRVLGAYDRKFWMLWKENAELRQQNAKMREQAAADSDLLAQAQGLRTQVQILNTRLDAITHSRGWALVLTLRRMRLRMAPRESRRERVLQLGMRALRIWGQEGPTALVRRVRHNISAWRMRRKIRSTPNTRYHEWLGENRVTERVRGLMRAEMGSWSYQPTLSLLMPVHNPPLAFLRAALESVREQVYGHWELCLADDGSESAVAQEVQRWAGLDPRIKVVRSEVNEGIAEATNRALGLASGEFVGLLDHDDVLDETALYYVAKALNQDPALDVLYSDKDHLTAEGVRVDPYFKPDWSAATLLSHNYVIHFLVCRKALVEQVGGWRKEYDGAQDYDLILRLTEQTDQIRHIPKVLYSWRRHGGSNSEQPKPAAIEAGQRAVEEALRRRGCAGTVESVGPAGPYRVRYALQGRPLVSIVISTCTVELLRACYASVKERTSYWNYEVVVATNAVGRAELRGYCEAEGLRLVEVVEGFFSKMNNAAVAAARGEYVVFLNDDTEIVTPGWLEELLGLCQQPEVAAVGPKLIRPNGQLWLAKAVMGIRRDGRPYFFDPFDAFGVSSFFGFSADIISEVMGLSASCMMVKRAVFLAAGGFDVEYLNLNVQDMDWSLRVRKMGQHILFTPYATVIHYVNFTKRQLPDIVGKDRGITNAFFARHRELLARGDPFFNPNLTDIGGFIEAPGFAGLDRVDVTTLCCGESHWWLHNPPSVPKEHAVAQRTVQVNELLPFATSVQMATGCRKAIDVGCGTGLLVEAFHLAGIEAWGLERSREALDCIPAEARGRIYEGDLLSAEDIACLKDARPFDVAICTEVLENSPLDLLDSAIRNLCGLSDTIVVTTPQPNLWDRDEKTHLCVMSRPFWVERFRQVEFVEDKEKGNRIFGKGYQSNPDRNAFVFVRANWGKKMVRPHRLWSSGE